MSTCGAMGQDISTPPSVDSWSKTESKVVALRHTWTIENFSYLKKEQVIVSTTFGVNSTDDVQWSLKVYPDGLDAESKNYLGVYLNLSACKTSGVLAKYKFTLLDSERKPVETMSSDDPFKFEKGKDWGFKKFVLKNTLFENPNTLRGDKLTVECKVSYVAGTSTRSGQYSQRKLTNIPAKARIPTEHTSPCASPPEPFLYGPLPPDTPFVFGSAPTPGPLSKVGTTKADAKPGSPQSKTNQKKTLQGKSAARHNDGKSTPQVLKPTNDVPYTTPALWNFDKFLATKPPFIDFSPAGIPSEEVSTETAAVVDQTQAPIRSVPFEGSKQTQPADTEAARESKSTTQQNNLSQTKGTPQGLNILQDKSVTSGSDTQKPRETLTEELLQNCKRTLAFRANVYSEIFKADSTSTKACGSSQPTKLGEVQTGVENLRLNDPAVQKRTSNGKQKDLHDQKTLCCDSGKSTSTEAALPRGDSTEPKETAKLAVPADLGSPKSPKIHDEVARQNDETAKPSESEAPFQKQSMDDDFDFSAEDFMSASDTEEENADTSSSSRSSFDMI